VKVIKTWIFLHEPDLRGSSILIEALKEAREKREKNEGESAQNKVQETAATIGSFFLPWLGSYCTLRY
jgi:hypothetical protein